MKEPYKFYLKGEEVLSKSKWVKEILNENRGKLGIWNRWKRNREGEDLQCVIFI